MKLDGSDVHRDNLRSNVKLCVVDTCQECMGVNERRTKMWRSSYLRDVCEFLRKNVDQSLCLVNNLC